MAKVQTVTQVTLLGTKLAEGTKKKVRSSFSKKKTSANASPVVPVADASTAVDLAICDVKYTIDPFERRKFKSKTGKPVTLHQWAVYDHVRKIPVGKVTTYKDICDALGTGSPRSVGSALRNNPFAPFVPCHRIIASNHFIGGFDGEWRGKIDMNDTKSNVQKKIRMLAKEGVGFSSEGIMLGGEKMIWR